MDAEGKVTTGTLSSAASGAVTHVALGRFAHTLNADLLPAYYEAVRRGMVFAGATAATGVAPGTAIGTTAAFSLANPVGSGKVLVPISASMGYISGTLGAGVVWYVANTNPNAAAVTGTAITVSRTFLSSAAAGNVGLAFTTATVPATPTILRPAWSLQASLASTAVAPWVVKDELAGEFIIDEGCTLSLEATAAAGSSPLVSYGMTWVEVEK